MAVFSAICGAILGCIGLAGVGGAAATAIACGAAVGAVGAVGAGVNKVKGAVEATQQSAQVQAQAAQTRVKMQQQQVARARRSAVRQQIVARSRARQSALARGVEGSSALRGGLASISSQIGANLGYGSMMSGLGQQYTSLTAQAAQLQGQEQLGFAQAGLLFGGAKFAFGQMQGPLDFSQSPFYSSGVSGGGGR